jgi:hypothetical protein
VAFETLFSSCRNFRLEADEIPMIECMLLHGPQLLPFAFDLNRVSVPGGRAARVIAFEESSFRFESIWL